MDLAQPRLVSREEIFAARPERAAKVRFTGLWVAGSLAGLQQQTVAVVGSRAPSDGGRAQARALGAALAGAGICVISGLALGIDAAAHTGAVERRCATVGVLGGGHSAFFPRDNRSLAGRMVRNGGAVISPFAPDHPAFPPQFLQRNAVVAALADVVVVVEAAARSGALNTASWAADLGIDVLAFPGDVDRSAAAGTNALIRDGATLVRDANDVLAALGSQASPMLGLTVLAAADRHRDDPAATAVLAQLRAGPLDPDRLERATRLRLPELIATLVRLEIAGTVERVDGTCFGIRVEF